MLYCFQVSRNRCIFIDYKNCTLWFIRVRSLCCLFCGLKQIYVMRCCHHYSTMWDSFTVLSIPHALPSHSSLFPSESLATTDLFIVAMVLPFPDCQIVGFMQPAAFSDRLLSLSNTCLRFCRAFLWLDSSFLFTTEQYSIIWCTAFCYPVTK